MLSAILFQKNLTGFNSIAVLPNSFIEIIAHITLFIDPINELTGINWVYWSLVCEMYYYIIIFISLVAYRRNYQYILYLVTIISLFLFPLEKGFFFIRLNTGQRLR